MKRKNYRFSSEDNLYDRTDPNISIQQLKLDNLEFFLTESHVLIRIFEAEAHSKLT